MLSLFLSSPTFLSATPSCNGGGGGRLGVAAASVQGSCAAVVCAQEAPRRAERHSASEVRARLGSQQACGTTCKQSSPSLLKGNAETPPPSVGLDSAPAGSIRCSVDARKGDEKEARTRGKCQAVSMRLNHIIHWFQGHFVSFLLSSSGFSHQMWTQRGDRGSL